MMNRRVLKGLGEKVEEGRTEIREVVLFSEGVDGNLSDIRSSVEIEGSP